MASLKGSKIAPKNPNLGNDGRAAARAVSIDHATKATTGDAGKAQGDRAKAAVKDSTGSA